MGRVAASIDAGSSRFRGDRQGCPQTGSRMDSTPAVESCRVPDEVIARGSIPPQRSWRWRDLNPHAAIAAQVSLLRLPCTPTGSREVVLHDRRSGCTGDVRCSAIELRRCGIPLAPVGLEPTTPGLSTMYSGPAVGHVLAATKVGQSAPLPNERRLPCRSQAEAVGIEPCTPGRQSPCFRMPDEGLPGDAFWRFGRPFQRSKPLAVDWPLHLRETPAPFTSRSPGIATLGPSCTPGRQSGLSSDLPANFCLRYFSAPIVDVIRVSSRSVRDAGGSRTHFKLLCRQPPYRPAPASKVSRPGIEPGTARRVVLRASRARARIRHTPGTCCFQYLARESNPVLWFRRPPCVPHTRKACFRGSSAPGGERWEWNPCLLLHRRTCLPRTPRTPCRMTHIRAESSAEGEGIEPSRP